MLGKKGKGKMGQKKPKAPKGMLESPEAVVKRLYQVYLDNCAKKCTIVCPGLKKVLKDCYENHRLIVKFVLEAIPDFQDEQLTNVCFDAVIKSIRQERYKWVKEFHVWNIPLKHETVANLALMLETGTYPLTRIDLVDCNFISSSVARLARPLALDTSLIASLCFDYNDIKVRGETFCMGLLKVPAQISNVLDEATSPPPIVGVSLRYANYEMWQRERFGDEGVKGLCLGLATNKVLQSLSLCYCDLGVESGAMLGELISKTAIREVFLNGNNLEAEGAIELIKLVVDRAEIESRERQNAVSLKAEVAALAPLEETQTLKIKTVIANAEKTNEEKPGSAKTEKGAKKNKKKGKKKKKIKTSPVPPPVGPFIYKVHLADNGIDSYGRGPNYAPVIAMRLFRTLIEHSMCLQEIDLDDNDIGDLGGRELMNGLKARDEANLPGIKISVSHKMNSDIFASIVKLGSGLKKKKKKKGKKKKKKK